MSTRNLRRAFGPVAIAAALLALGAGTARAQSLEGSKWTIEQEGSDGTVLWWLGSEGRVRTGDVGTILPGYRWRMSGDSLVVTVGDSVRYAAMLMSGRLVGGVRTGRGRAEGWWSAERADAPTQVASTPTTPAVTQPMSRPTDAGVQPTTPTTTPGTTPTGGRRPIRRIEREGETSAPPTTQPTTTPTTTPATTSTPAGDGHEIRRLPRPNRPGATPAAPTAAAATPPIDAAQLIGHWVHTNPNSGIALDLRTDSTFTLVRRNASEQSGRWQVEPGAVVIKVNLLGDDERDVLATLDGTTLILQPRGGLLRLTLTRGPSGPSREPAVRQP